MLPACVFLSLLLISDVLSQCSKDAKLYITAPRKMQGLSESCLEIPCNFSHLEKLDSSASTSGVWIKNDSNFKNRQNNVIFNSSEVANTYPMKFTGKLSEGNCTTLFSNLTKAHSDTYFFRVESINFMATASCSSLKIEVQDSPPSPEIMIPDDLRENVSVRVTCTAVAPCPQFHPQLSWNLQDSWSQTLKGDDRIPKIQILTTLRLTEEDDGLNVTCVASYLVKSTFRNVTQAKTLNVSYGPKDTKVSVSREGLLQAGSWVTLNCSSRAKPPITNFTWFRISQDGREEKLNVSEGPVYSFNLTEGGVYRCEASNNLSTDSSTITLTIEGQINSTEVIVAGVIGVIGVILLLGGVVAIWWFKSRLATSQRRQRQAAVEESPGAEKTEEIHYGQVIFSKKSPEQTSSQTTNSRGQQCTLSAQEAVYAQVKLKK